MTTYPEKGPPALPLDYPAVFRYNITAEMTRTDKFCSRSGTAAVVFLHRR